MQRIWSLAIVVPLMCVACPTHAQAPDKFTQPPNEESEQIKGLIDKAAAALDSGKSTTDILADPDYLVAHEWPRFRKLIRQKAQESRIRMVCPAEPGVSLIVTGTVVDQDGKPRAGAVLYAYQTSANGCYSDRAAHISGNEGDRKHARLFGYLKTDDAGRFQIRTIRPAGYPNSDLPAHIHLEVERGDGNPGALITELQFDDDPRLTAEKRTRSRNEGFIIGTVKTDEDKSQRVEIKLRTL
jgi:protocatechuate 3,4-dioxygenase beta subunit